MNALQPKFDRQPKIFFFLGNVVVLCLLCLIGAACLLYWAYRSRFADSARLEHERQLVTNQVQRAELEKQRGIQEAHLAMARTRQTEALARIRAATNVLVQLFTEASSVGGHASSLRTNELGRLAGLHPDVVALAKRFYDSEILQLPAIPDISEKIEGARRFEQQLVDAVGTAYEPEASLFATNEVFVLWAQEGLRKTAQVRGLLSHLEQEAKVKFSTTPLLPTSPTLEVAVQKQVQAEATSKQVAIVEQTREAQTAAVQAVAQAEAQKIIEAANREAETIRREIADAKADLARKEEIHAAEEKLRTAQAKAAAQQKVDESSKVGLRTKASDPQIRARLAPFTTPGYMDAYGRTMLEKKAHSYSVLKSGGALEPNPAGLQMIASLAYTRVDKVRPRWSFQKGNARGWRYNTQEMALVQEAQNLLAELGPVLVEMGLLEP